MGYERYGRGDPQRDDGRRESRLGQDHGSGSDYGYAAARDYGAGREAGGARDYGRQDYGYQRYDQRERMGGGGWGGEDRYGYDRDRFDREEGRDRSGGGREDYRGADRGRRVGVYGGNDDSRYGRGGDRQQRGSSSRSGGDDRGFLDRAGDEVRSWFGDEEAERRREQDARGASGGYGRDEHYHSWRNQQLEQFDRDYHEYRQENQSKFHNEFAAFRSERQGQRDLLNGVSEHAEVVGSDGEHIGTVDKVRGDRIILTKNDQDAGGRHHSIPSRWLQSADGGKVTLRKTAAEAKQHWRDEERQEQDRDSSRAAMFGDRDRDRDDRVDPGSTPQHPTNLNRSFSGTY